MTGGLDIKAQALLRVDAASVEFRFNRLVNGLEARRTIREHDYFGAGIRFVYEVYLTESETFLLGMLASGVGAGQNSRAGARLGQNGCLAKKVSFTS